jgi:hypothetical protein
MSSEQNLNSPDFTGNATSAIGAVAVTQAAIGMSGWQRTRDTLSDIHKANQVNATAYNFIKEVSTSETEVRCVANLALRGGGTFEYDFRIYLDGSEIKVEITNSRNP